MLNPQTFGDILRAGRESHGLSAKQLAEQLDRSRASIQSWERNESEPPPADVERLIELLGLDRSAITEVEAANNSARPDPSDASQPRDTETEPETDEDEPDRDTDSDVIAEDEVEVDAEADTVAHPMLPVPAGPHAADKPPEPVRSDAGATSSTATSTSSFPAEAPRQGFFATIRDPEKPWLGYIRAFLTIVVLATLGWAFLWAVRELFSAVQDLRGSEANGVEALAFMVLLRTRAR